MAYFACIAQIHSPMVSHSCVGPTGPQAVFTKCCVNISMLDQGWVISSNIPPPGWRQDLFLCGIIGNPDKVLLTIRNFFELCVVFFILSPLDTNYVPKIFCEPIPEAARSKAWVCGRSLLVALAVRLRFDSRRLHGCLSVVNVMCCRVYFLILIVKPTRCTKFSNLFLE